MWTPRSWAASTSSGERILQDGVNRSRRAGWQHLHIVIDDHTRLAYAEVLPGQDKHACAAFLDRAIRWYQRHGIHVERVLTDNAKAYRTASGGWSAPADASAAATPARTRLAPTAKPKR